MLAANPGMPDVSVTLDPTTTAAQRVQPGAARPADGRTGPLQYFKPKFPTDIVQRRRPGRRRALGRGRVGRREGGAWSTWATRSSTTSVPVTQTDFTQNVIAMKNAGVKILFIDQMPENYASAVFKALDQQNFHPR